MEEKIFYLSGLLFFISTCLWYLTKMWKIDNSKKEKNYLEEELRKSEEYRRQELEDVSRFYTEKIDFMKQQSRQSERQYQYLSPQQQRSCERSFKELKKSIPKKKEERFKKEKTINRNIKDPATGDRLEIVICHCGTTHNEDSYDLYGCCECENKTINQK